MFNFNNKADFNGDGLTDILWRGAEGEIVIWNMSADGLRINDDGYVAPPAGLTLRGYGDTTANGTSDMIFQDGAGVIHAWNFINNDVVGYSDLTQQTRLAVTALGDFDGNGRTDFLYYNPPLSPFGGVPGTYMTGWLEEGRKVPPVYLGSFPKTSLDYKFVAVGDLDGDGRDGLLFRGTGGPGARNFLLQEPTGAISENGVMPAKTAFLTDPGQDWAVLKLADFNGDGKDDVLWQRSNGDHALWTMDGGNLVSGKMLVNPGNDWSIVGVQDYNNDGKSDLMWHHGPTGWNCEWFMDGADIQAQGANFYLPGNYWSVIG